MNKVTAWLQSPKKDYQTGVSIYNEYDTRKEYGNYFASVTNPSENAMQFKLLIKRIQLIERKLLSNPNLVKPDTTVNRTIQVVEIKKKTTEKPHIVDNPLVDVKELPKELQDKYFENKGLTLKLSALHQQLRELNPESSFDAVRKEIAGSIISIDEKRSDNWKAIDSYWNSKKNPEQLPVEDGKKTLTEQANRIYNLKNYIRREKAKLAKTPDKYKPGTVSRERIEKKIAEHQKELNELEQ